MLRYQRKLVAGLLTNLACRPVCKGPAAYYTSIHHLLPTATDHVHAKAHRTQADAAVRRRANAAPSRSADARSIRRAPTQTRPTSSSLRSRKPRDPTHPARPRNSLPAEPRCSGAPRVVGHATAFASRVFDPEANSLPYAKCVRVARQPTPRASSHALDSLRTSFYVRGHASAFASRA